MRKDRDTIKKIQKYIDVNNIYQVEFGHYEKPLGMKWIPLQTKKVHLEDVFKNEDND